MRSVLFASGPTGSAIDAAVATRADIVIADSRDVAALRAALRAASPAVSSAISPAASPAISPAASSAPEPEVIAFSPVVVLRLWMMLGFASTEVLALSHGRGHRAMKLLAYFVRGRVVFIREDGRAPLGLGTFLWITVSRLWARENGALLVGSASPETLYRLEADLRARRPNATVQLLENPSLGDFLRVAANWRRYRYLSIPWTGEGHNLLKFAALFLPCGSREICNEAGDSFSVRRTWTLAAHIGRRMRDRAIVTWQSIRYLAWRTSDALRTASNGVAYAAWWTRDRTLAAWYRLRAIRPGVTVIGSASGFYMKDIVADLRRKHPGEPIYGLLPARLVAPTGKLFDAVIPMSISGILTHALGRNRTGYLAIPCTNEGYNRYKLLGVLLPLGRRVIYNENHDGYSVRSGSFLVEHGFWRLRHRLFYQAFTQRRGRPWIVLIMHLLLYPFRLLAGAMVLAGIRLRAKSPVVVVGPTPTLPDSATVATAAAASGESARMHSPQVLDVADP